MERHKCKLCSRTFANGRALGGHMKAHLAAFSALPSNPPEKLGEPEDSASSSSSSSDEDPELGDKETEEEKALGFYGLRENPRKSFKFSDPGFAFAADSESVIQDGESETESKNPAGRRSKRSRKSNEIEKQENASSKKPSLEDSPEPVSSVSDTSQEEDVAMCLVMLSRDMWIKKNEGEEGGGEEEDREQGKKKRTRSEVEGCENNFKRVPRKNRCEKCTKAFRSYRALCAHRKICLRDAEEVRNGGNGKIFECPFCFKIFGSGQALGGHKRSHLLGSTATAIHASPSDSPKLGLTSIDLNLPAPVDEDDYSVVSDA